MKGWPIKLGLVVVIFAAGFWAWQVFSPNPERVIRNRLQELARTVSVFGNESVPARMMRIKKLGDFLTEDVQISVDLPGHSKREIDGRDEAMQAAAVAAELAGRLSVEFVDVTVTVGPDKTTAIAVLTAKGTAGGEKDNLVQEMKFSLKKGENGWLINRVETVRTLLRNNCEDLLQRPG